MRCKNPNFDCRREINLDQRLVFVVRPMRDSDDDDVFNHILKPAVENARYRNNRLAQLRCEDAQTNPQRDQFSCDACFKIHCAFCVIVDLSKQRPNVFYELGIAHALGKPTKLICRDAGGSGASDISHLRYVSFDLNPAGVNKLRGEIQTWVEEQLEKRRRSQAMAQIPPSSPAVTLPRSILEQLHPQLPPLQEPPLGPWTR